MRGMLPSTSRPARHRAAPAPDPVGPSPVVPNDPSPALAPAVSSPAIGEAEASWVRAAPAVRGAHDGHGLVAVGPGLAGSWLDAGGVVMNPMPIQPAKIHCPPERQDTLSRTRLNTWLDRAAAGRLALGVAEAGFGKTTLLGDWARHTRRLTAWYRLEPDDRDWLTFIRHLVASGRELHPGFAPDTYAMLLALGSGGPTRADLVAGIAREMAAFASSRDTGFSLLIDDYHLVDGCAETDPIVRALLERTGPGFSLVIASRALPTLRLGRLRSGGGVMTLTGRDLRFDVDETSSLFRDAYRQPLEDDLVSDLCERTEGWAALLALTRNRVEETADARSVIMRLSASSGDLYDFLAEEVIAALDPTLEHFLTWASVLTAIDARGASLVDATPNQPAWEAIREAERLGLLSRPDSESPHQFHPLVREFLASRLLSRIGVDAVKSLHRSIAVALQAFDWHAAAWHYRKAGEPDEAADLIDRSIPSILAGGQYEAARAFLDGSAGSPDRPGSLILRSRLELERGNVHGARRLAQQGVTAAGSGPLAALAIRNLSAMHGRQGFGTESVVLASEALAGLADQSERNVAEATMVVSATQEEGDLSAAANFLSALASSQDAAGLPRYAAVTRLNLAVILLWLGRAAEAARVAGRAEVDLGSPGASAERVAALAVRVSASVQGGDLAAIDTLVRLARDAATVTARDEAAIEAARLLADYGPTDSAVAVLAMVSEDAKAAGYRGAWAAISATLALRQGQPEAALAMLEAASGVLQDAAGRFRLSLLLARIELGAGRSTETAIGESQRLADAQASPLCQSMARTIACLAGHQGDAAIAQLMADERHILSVMADEVCRELPRLSIPSVAVVREQAVARPQRWSSALRLRLPGDRVAAALLAEIGDESDLAALRSIAESPSARRLRPLVASMARRLAPPVVIHDLGQVGLSIGGRPVDKSLRRKVLALLCFLSTKPGLASTRDEAVDAIWPDLGADTAVNSLHQTIYFLRRVFEPDYREGFSAGYLSFDGDVVALDGSLVASESGQVWRHLTEARGGAPTTISRLLDLYRGQFALDFAYDDWAAPYRERLHAAVLAAVEAGMRDASARGEAETAIGFGHRLLAIDPHADAIELELLRAYKRGGRQAAAAEQYAHYAAYVRGELGAEPIGFAEI